ncbi:unnamed protein product [Rhizophagus irregularis]|nr:unnamed protein product [Rhizophagus irregularis]CAB4405927.1 unnamed protein product [Rhizophagus irregularis]
MQIQILLTSFTSCDSLIVFIHKYIILSQLINFIRLSTLKNSIHLSTLQLLTATKMAANIATRLNFDEEETKAFHGMAIAKKMLSLFYLLKYQIWQTEKQEKLYEKQLTNS